MTIKAKHFCEFCSYSATTEAQMEVHLAKFHEAVIAERGNRAQRQTGERGWKPPKYNAVFGPGWANAECNECKGAGFVYPLRTVEETIAPGEPGYAAGLVHIRSILKPDYSKVITCPTCKPRWLAAKAAGTLF